MSSKDERKDDGEKERKIRRKLKREAEPSSSETKKVRLVKSEAKKESVSKQTANQVKIDCDIPPRRSLCDCVLRFSTGHVK